MAERSPSWKRPSEIMKMHRRKKRMPICKPFIVPKDFVDKNVLLDTTSVRANAKRRNPFGCEDLPRKRANLAANGSEISETNNEFPGKLLTILDVAENKPQISSNVEITPPCDVYSRELPDESSKDAQKAVNVTQEIVTQNVTSCGIIPASKTNNVKENTLERINRCAYHETFPSDWSLKQKMRVISNTSFLWCNQLKTAEETRGITDFVKSNKQTEIADNKATFQRCLMYWIHPNLPWMKLFPRIVPESSSSVSGNINILNEEVQRTLQSDWTESFTSAYHLLRSEHCPYFYVCTHQFTVLFRAARLSPDAVMSALLTPTTRGLREALKEEGISFTMPFMKDKVLGDKSTDSNLPKQDCKNIEDENIKDRLENTENDSDDDLIGTDEGASVWLESIGLDKAKFPSLDPNKVKVQREGFRAIDNRPESLVYTEGLEVHALFNFLLNCRSCVANSGVQAGVPPTILSPSAFKGATLKSRRVKQSAIKQPDQDGNVTKSYVLEILGPLLIGDVQNMSTLFKSSQDDNFLVSLNTHEPSAAFNVVPCNFKASMSDVDDIIAEQCENMEEVPCETEQCNGKHALKEITCVNGKYQWSL